MPRRLIWWALVLPVCISGCSATLGGRQAIRPDKIAPRFPVASAVAEQVDQHNRNARLIQGLDATPTVSIQSSRNGGGGSARGVLALERPRNFALRLETAMGRDLANVGSNNDQFWFWTRDSKEPAIFVCSYEAGGEPPAELSFHPDWIIESLGLREIDDAETRRIHVQPGRETGTTVWTHKRVDPQGHTAIKQTVIDNSSGQIKQHAFFAPDGKTVLALATPTQYKTIKLEGEKTVSIPHEIQIRIASPAAPAQTMAMTIVLDHLRLNPSFSQAQRDELFVVPKIKGYQVVELNNRKTAGRATATAQPGERRAPGTPPVGLGDPAPIGLDGAQLRRSDPLPLQTDLAETPQRDPAGSVVGIRLPRAPESPGSDAPSLDPWARAGPLGVER
jgi:hypothetical protein